MILILIALALLSCILYKYLTKPFDYWQKKGVPTIKPIPILGNIKDVIFQKKQLGHFIAECYNKIDKPFFGLYMLSTPILVLKDRDLVKTVLVKDFNYFCNHAVEADEELDPVISRVLFVLKNKTWKFMRSRISPIFSSKKTKHSAQLINKVGEEMVAYIKTHCLHQKIDARDVIMKYMANVVANCAFGIDAHCFQSEKSEFLEIAKTIFSTEFPTGLRQAMYFLVPSFMTALKIPILDNKVNVFMRKMIWDTIGQREMNNYKRNDLIDVMVEIKNKTRNDDVVKFEGDWVVAQAGQFYFAGFETVSNTLGFLIYELSLRPDIQQKLREEFKLTRNEFKEFNSEAIQDMKYLHMVVCETLRKYPVLPFLDRRCVQDYQLPDTNIIIEKGTEVQIPVLGLHYDSEYFPEPENFDPERFAPQNKINIPPYAYIPFGEGPRICIGERFGLLATKMAAIHILSHFKIERTSEVATSLKLSNKGFFLTSATGISIKFTEL